MVSLFALIGGYQIIIRELCSLIRSIGSFFSAFTSEFSIVSLNSPIHLVRSFHLPPEIVNSIIMAVLITSRYNGSFGKTLQICHSFSVLISNANETSRNNERRSSIELSAVACINVCHCCCSDFTKLSASDEGPVLVFALLKLTRN